MIYSINSIHSMIIRIYSEGADDLPLDLQAAAELRDSEGTRSSVAESAADA